MYKGMDIFFEDIAQSIKEIWKKIIIVIPLLLSIAILGWSMWTVLVPATIKGAAFPWLPAALQLFAGVWLGPVWGGIAAGLGSYGAGILAYGGWGIVDIIMNPIAGGLANSVLPYYLFKWLNIYPAISNVSKEELKGSWWKGLILITISLAAGLLNILFKLPSPWGYAIPLAVLLTFAAILLGCRVIKSKNFYLAILVAFIISAISALIGTFGIWYVGDQLPDNLIDIFIKWFAGDAVANVLGVLLLILFIPWAKKANK